MEHEMKTFNYTVLAVAFLGLAGVAQADTSSGQSYDGTIVVDGSSGTGTAITRVQRANLPWA